MKVVFNISLSKVAFALVIFLWISYFVLVNPMLTEEYIPSTCGYTCGYGIDGAVGCYHEHPACIKYTRLIDDGIGICCDSCTMGWGYCPPPFWNGNLLLLIISTVCAMLIWVLENILDTKRKADET